MSISIAPAQRDDLSAIAEINRRAYGEELVTRFAFTQEPDSKTMHEFFKARIASRFDDARTAIFKATDDATGEVLGFACWTLEAVDEAVPPPTGKLVQDRDSAPRFMDLEFVMAAGKVVEALGRHRKAETHYYLSAFAVDPSRQGQGIGTRLLRHCLRLADRASLPSWLISLPGSHSLYAREGFVDVDSADIDLNAWDKSRHRGYGIYRQYAMVRRPLEAA
ncbi:acyl-CoA N-acyltransferase [Nemania sp. FL0916]|nr:acyl-CoA N-acyltransferase [Nemania sp. FL0916]